MIWIRCVKQDEPIHSIISIPNSSKEGVDFKTKKPMLRFGPFWNHETFLVLPFYGLSLCPRVPSID